MSRTPRGVRSVNEKVIQDGRALLITSKTEADYDWSDIPYGSIFVNSTTGTISIKLEDQDDWVPLPELLKDGNNSLIIARDGKIVTEVYNVTKIDTENKEIQYESKEGKYAYGEIIEDEVSGQTMYVMELFNGSYLPKRNQITVTINDTLERTAASGGLVEISNRKIGITDELKVGDELTVTYYMRILVGNPYPRVYMSEYLPDNPEEGDFWLDLTEPPVDGETYPETTIDETVTRYVSPTTSNS